MPMEPGFVSESGLWGFTPIAGCLRERAVSGLNLITPGHWPCDVTSHICF